MKGIPAVVLEGGSELDHRHDIVMGNLKVIGVVVTVRAAVNGDPVCSITWHLHSFQTRFTFIGFPCRTMNI